jgi:glucokinase
MILAGDIGGTKTVLALIDPENGVEEPIQETIYPSGEYDSLVDIVAEFLDEVGEKPLAASFGVAGPVVQGRAEITNLPWIIDADEIGQEFSIPTVHLLNDLEAIATAVPHLGPHDLAPLNEGKTDPTGTIAVIAPGTGLGEAFLTWDGQRHRAYPSEGGHVSFAPGAKEELELLTYLQPRFGHVSFERVCSGIGIGNIYDYMRDSGRYPEPEWLADELAAVKDRTPIIVQTAQKKETPICRAALDLFIKILGGEAGNFALKVLATGGVYLGGGIPPRIIPDLQEGAFLYNLVDKGRFRDLLQEVPVHVILNPKVALYGAAHDGLECLR